MTEPDDAQQRGVDPDEEQTWRVRLQTIARSRVLSRRSTALLVLAVLSLVWGIGLLLQPPRGKTVTLYDALYSILTPHAWAVVWIAVGVFAGTVALLRPTRDRLAYGAVSTLFATWAAGTAWDWLTTGLVRGWVPAALLALVALLTIVIAGWPE